MTFVRIHEEESFEIALKKFRYKYKGAGIYAEVRKKRYYENPSTRKQRTILSAKRYRIKKAGGYAQEDLVKKGAENSLVSAELTTTIYILSRERRDYVY